MIKQERQDRAAFPIGSLVRASIPGTSGCFRVVDRASKPKPGHRHLEETAAPGETRQISLKAHEVPIADISPAPPKRIVALNE